MRLLVTRPAPDGERTAGLLRARGHDVLVASLLHIEPVVDAGFGAGPWTGVLLTSANAARAVAQHRRVAELLRLPAFAVGERTAQAARLAGFGDVVPAGGNVVELAILVAASVRTRNERLLYLAGAERAGDLAAELLAQGVPVETTVIYRAVANTHFPPYAWSALDLGRLDGVLHYSRRSAEVYLNCARAAGVLDKARAPSHYCLSAQVAAPLIAEGAKTVRVARSPDEAALVDLVDAP